MSLRRCCQLLLGALALAACNSGEGEGAVRSERLYVTDCWDGAFDLMPTFFSAIPYRQEQLIIKVQRGDASEEVSDGLIVVINDLPELRSSSLGTAVEVGLPPGVVPIGLPITFDPEPPRVSMSLYLRDSCHLQNPALYGVSGTITFQALFSGDANERRTEERLTDATFDVTFADPRQLNPDGTVDATRSSRVTGWFRFYFERGRPAQPFQ